MKLIRCEMCGGTDIIKQDGLFVCQNCGVKYSLEEARKMLVEGTIKVDRTQEIENLLIRASQFEEEGKKPKAEEYYNRVLDIEASNEKALEGLKNLKKRKGDCKCPMCGANVHEDEKNCSICGFIF